MQTRIREVRLSFVRFERWGDIWSAANPIALELLRSADGYTKEFDQAIQDTVIGPLNDQPIPPSRLEPTALTPPWPITKPKYSHWFWVYYLGKNPENVDGQLALAKLAPFHTGFTATIKPHSKWIGAIADGFIYPYGVGLILTLVAYLDRDTKGGLQSGLAMSKLLEASSEELYDITWNGAPPIAKKVPELADALLDRLRAQAIEQRVRQLGDLLGNRRRSIPGDVVEFFAGGFEQLAHCEAALQAALRIAVQVGDKREYQPNPIRIDESVGDGADPLAVRLNGCRESGVKRR